MIQGNLKIFLVQANRDWNSTAPSRSGVRVARPGERAVAQHSNLLDQGLDVGLGLDQPYGIAFSPSGDLYVSNIGNGTITKTAGGGDSQGPDSWLGLLETPLSEE